MIFRPNLNPEIKISEIREIRGLLHLNSRELASIRGSHSFFQ
jgi:hypothetical protein